MKNIVGILCFSILLIVGTEGHGMLMDPVSRSSRWRFNSTAPKNFDDNANECGGLEVQWKKNSGKCGICGDNFGDPQPRANELGGKYGEGVIVKVYENVPSAEVNMKITSNHLGYVHFDLCNLDQSGSETEECFLENRLKFSDGSDKFDIGTKNGTITTSIDLPAGLSCKHCVLRWTYTAANNWGKCEKGKGKKGRKGCGPQETIKTCSDISIVAANNDQPEVPAEI